MNTIIGNTISLIACTIMVISGYIKSKNKTLTLQSIQLGLSVIAYGFLSAYSAMVINLLSIPRNILVQKNKLKLSYKIILLLITITISCIVTIQKSKTLGYMDWIGFVPLISTTTYLLLVNKVNDVQFKYLVIFTMVIWIIHDVITKNYISVIFNFMNIITSLLAVYKIKKKEG